jgi:hypothetical protein
MGKKLSKRRAKALGRKGGRATARKHGNSYMREIGRKGFLATLARHWQGDRAGMLRWLHSRAHFAIVEALAALDLAAQIEAGATCACTEIPVIDDEE